jgi:DNA-binding winged helix-turn-helix (wHTH) protein
MSHTASTQADVPRLIEELRRHIVRKTGKPIDPDVDFLTTQIEVLSGSGPIETPWLDLEYGLTPQMGKLLTHLASRPGKVFPRAALLNALYFHTDDAAIDKIIDVIISKLRVVLRQNNAPFWIETVWGEGWRYVNTPARQGKMYFNSTEERLAKPPTSDKSRRTEWRGAVMGHGQARICDVLFASLGKWISSFEIAKQAKVSRGGVAAMVSFICINLEPTPYMIENAVGFGYRMVLKPT